MPKKNCGIFKNMFQGLNLALFLIKFSSTIGAKNVELLGIFFKGLKRKFLRGFFQGLKVEKVIFLYFFVGKSNVKFLKKHF